MQVRNLFLLVCLLAASFLQANPTALFTPENPTPTSSEFSCNLPAPTNFQVAGSGPNWVHLTWDLTNPFHAHRINVYTCDEDSTLVTTLLVDAGITDTTIFFLQGGLYLFEIKASCTSGDSKASAWTDCIDIIGSGLILDLIVSGYTPDLGSGNCTLPPGGAGHPNNYARCYFTNNLISTFRIRQTNWMSNKKNFCIQRIFDPEDEGNPHFELDPLVFNNEGEEDPHEYEFYVNLQAPDATGTEYQIMQYRRIVARFVANYHEDTGESFLQRVYIAEGYEIVRISGYVSGTTPGTGGRTDQVALTTHDATTAPNPFTETLDVYPGKPSAENIRLQLYNLSGQKVLDQQFPGGQVQYSLATASLSPGFYFLRIEADGEVQTLKVVKSE